MTFQIIGLLDTQDETLEVHMVAKNAIVRQRIHVLATLEKLKKEV